MTRELEPNILRQRVRDVAQFLRDRVVVETTRAGWHNTFEPGRIGTSGTAIPARFFLEAGESLPQLDKVLESLRHPQHDTASEAAWSILSLGPAPNVEGTAWPLRALVSAGLPQDESLILRARAWLRGQQNDDGGWGSNDQNESRVTLTAAAVGALVEHELHRSATLENAEKWLRDGQRTQDGSWGATPGESGTLSHTALALMALLKLGADPADAAIRSGRTYLLDLWKPRPKAIETERYDVHDSSGYRRTLLEHDVDALVIEVLLSMGLVDDLETILHGAQGIYALGYREMEADKISLWNVLPRAFLALRLLEAIPAGTARVVARKGTVAVVSDQAKRPALSLGAVAWRLLPFVPRRLLHFLILVAVLVIGALTVLLIKDKIEWGEYLGSVVLATILGIIGLLKNRSD